MLTHKGTKALTTPRLTLRRFTMNDADQMFRNWASDPKVTRYLMWLPHADVGVSKQVLSAWVPEYARDGFYNWGIEFEGELIGGISVVNASDQHEWAEIGYCIGSRHWGKGIMTEALRRVMAFMFDEVGLNRIYLRHDALNPASGRVMEKCGLTYEGTLRRHHKRGDGVFGDLKVYGMLREEWPKDYA